MWLPCEKERGGYPKDEFGTLFAIYQLFFKGDDDNDVSEFSLFVEIYLFIFILD